MIRRAKVVVTSVDNGYIVRVIDHGMGALKEPYVKDLLVFSTFQEVSGYLEGLFTL